jgi:hypothetical protein
MGFQDRLADARKAAERARAQQQEWSQARHEAKEQQALAKQETEAEKKAAERQAPAVKVMRYKNTKDYERDARQMLAQGWRIEAQTSQRGRVNMGRTVLKAGVFLPWAVMRPSRKGDPITVTWLRGGDLVEIDAPGEQLARPAAAPTRGKISVVDWSTWKPGWPAAAQTLNDVGLAKVLEHCHIPVEGLDQTAISQIGTVLADGITNGLTGPALARQIRAYVGGDRNSP